MRIGFAFTGAGHLLNESVQLAEKLAKDHEVTIFLSGAAEYVLKMYGLYERVTRLTGGKYRELATDSNQKSSYPITGRLSLGKYDLLIVSPATGRLMVSMYCPVYDEDGTTMVGYVGGGAFFEGLETLLNSLKAGTESTNRYCMINVETGTYIYCEDESLMTKEITFMPTISSVYYTTTS